VISVADPVEAVWDPPHESVPSVLIKVPVERLPPAALKLSLRGRALSLGPNSHSGTIF